MDTATSSLDSSMVGLVCRRCSKPLEWGQAVCPECGTRPISGLPRILDVLVAWMIELVLTLILFGILTWLLGNLVPTPVRIVIAALVVYWKLASLGLRPGMGFDPKAARTKLVVRPGADAEHLPEEEPFDFAVSVQEWNDPSIHIDSLDRVFKGISYDWNKARLCGLLPPPMIADRLIELSQSSEGLVRREALRSMIRLRDPCFAPSMRGLISDAGIDKKVRQEAEDCLTSMEDI